MNRPRGKPFEVGNKFGHGRPKGSRNKTNAEFKKILIEYSIPLLMKCLAKGLAGDSQALKICLDLIQSMMRDPPVRVKLPEVRDLKGCDTAIGIVANGILNGKIPDARGGRLFDMLVKLIEIFEKRDFEPRLSALENQHSLSSLGQGNVGPPSEPF